MKPNEHTPVVLSAWIPITDPYDLASLGKLAEELSECGSAVARCMIQGVEGEHPVTGKSNRLWLSEEIGDALAMIAVAVEHFGLDGTFIAARRDGKTAHMEGWFKLLQEIPLK